MPIDRLPSLVGCLLTHDLRAYMMTCLWSARGSPLFPTESRRVIHLSLNPSDNDLAFSMGCENGSGDDRRTRCISEAACDLRNLCELEVGGQSERVRLSLRPFFRLRSPPDPLGHNTHTAWLVETGCAGWTAPSSIQT